MNNSDMLRNITKIAGGTGISQVIYLCSIPLLTRIYTPEQFESFSAFNALVVIFSSIICLRFDIATTIPKNSKEAQIIFRISAFFSIILSCILLLIMFVLSEGVNKYTKLDSSLIVLIPICVMLNGLYSTCQNYSSRKKYFSLIAKSKIIKVLFGVIFQLALGVAGNLGGMIIGHTINSFCGFLYLRKNHSLRIFKDFEIKRYVSTFKKYSNFPKYSVPESLLNSSSLQVPILIISSYSIGPQAGYLFLAIKVLGAPLGLVSNAISQVYLSDAPQKERDNELAKYTSKIVNYIAYLLIPLISLISIVAPFIFTVIFGREWHRAGEIVCLLAPLLSFQALVSPVSMALHVKGLQKEAFRIQVVGLVLRVGIVLFSAFYHPQYLIEAFAFSGFVFYFFYSYLVFKCVKLEIYKYIFPTLFFSLIPIIFIA
ncbi:oligosaccharide flippase family protein [Vibrio breoganii]